MGVSARQSTLCQKPALASRRSTRMRARVERCRTLCTRLPAVVTGGRSAPTALGANDHPLPAPAAATDAVCCTALCYTALCCARGSVCAARHCFVVCHRRRCRRRMLRAVGVLGTFHATPGWEDLFAQRKIDQGHFYASKDNLYPTKGATCSSANKGSAMLPHKRNLSRQSNHWIFNVFMLRAQMHE